MPNRGTVNNMLKDRWVYDLQSYVRRVYDFDGDSSDTVEDPWRLTAATDTSADATTSLVSDVTNGEFQLQHGSAAEAEELVADFNGYLPINLSQNPYIEMSVKIAFASGGVLGSADQRAVFGVGSAYNATLDDVTTNAWFRIDGNNADILIESDDGTTDSDDEDTDKDLADDTWTILAIDFSDLSSVKFYVDGFGVGEKDMSNLSSDTMVQPIIAIQRDGGSEQEDLRGDFVAYVQDRA